MGKQKPTHSMDIRVSWLDLVDKNRRLEKEIAKNGMKVKMFENVIAMAANLFDFSTGLNRLILDASDADWMHTVVDG